MGSQFEFTCGGCGYRAEVAGGKDAGMMAVLQTMTCHDCKDLVDVLIGQYGEDGPIGDPELDKRLGSCPRCGGKKVVPWDELRPCPRCDSKMTQGELIIMWD